MIDLSPTAHIHATWNLKTVVKELRERAQLSQSQLARLLACSHTTICRYEDGKIIPQPGYIALLAMQVWNSPLQHHGDDPAQQERWLAEINRIQARFFPDHKPYRSWAKLCEAAEQHIKDFRKQERRQKQRRVSNPDSAHITRQQVERASRFIKSLENRNAQEQAAVELLKCMAAFAENQPVPMDLLRLCIDPAALLGQYLEPLLSLKLIQHTDTGLLLPAAVHYALQPALSTSMHTKAEQVLLRWAESVTSTRIPAHLKLLVPQLEAWAQKPSVQAQGQSARFSQLAGWCHDLLGNYAAARYQLELACQQHELAHMNMSLYSEDFLHALNMLALVYHTQAQLLQAERTFRRVLTVWKQQKGDPYNISTVQNNMGRLLIDRGDFHHARPLFFEALPACIEAKGEHSDPTARIYNNIGYCAIFAGNYAEAQEYLQRAQAIRRDVHAPGHQAIAFNRSYLGLLELCQGRYNQATELLSSAISDLENCFHTNHPELTEHLRYLGLAQIGGGHYQLGVSTLLHSLRVALHSASRDYVDYVRTLDILAQLGIVTHEGSPEQARTHIAVIYNEQLIASHPDCQRLQLPFQHQKHIVVPQLLGVEIRVE